jgi:hypothetical protein
MNYDTHHFSSVFLKMGNAGIQCQNKKVIGCPNSISIKILGTGSVSSKSLFPSQPLFPHQILKKRKIANAYKILLLS